MSELKVGDKVICLDPVKNYLYLYEIYLISGVDRYYVKVDGGCWWYHKSRFILLDDYEKEMLKIARDSLQKGQEVWEKTMQFEKNNMKKLKEFQLPDKWCIKQSLSEEVCEWFRKFYPTGVANIKGTWKYLAYNNITNKASFEYNKLEYTEITLNQFKEYVLKQKDMSNNLKITKERVLETIKKYPVSKNVLEELFPEVKVEEKFYRIGQKFYLDGNTYILCQAVTEVFGHVGFINVTNGNCWSRFIQVGCINEITQEEFEEIESSRKGGFKLIT